jgi:endoglucanase
MDGATIYNQELFKAITAVADKEGIAWQTKTYISGGTDASAIQRSGAGAKVAGIAAAVRYIHSPSCVACINDFEDIYKLVKAYMGTL